MIHRSNTKVGIKAELSWEINKNVHFFFPLLLLEEKERGGGGLKI